MSRINSLLVSCMMLVVLTGCPVNPCLKPIGTKLYYCMRGSRESASRLQLVL